MEARCDHCKFWLQGNQVVGVCRRHAPIAVILEGDVYTTLGTKLSAQWPVTEARCWCGDFESNEFLGDEKTRIAELPEIEAMIRSDEREACARVIETLIFTDSPLYSSGKAIASIFADAIRNRK